MWENEKQEGANGGEQSEGRAAHDSDRRAYGCSVDSVARTSVCVVKDGITDFAGTDHLLSPSMCATKRLACLAAALIATR